MELQQKLRNKYDLSYIMIGLHPDEWEDNYHGVEFSLG